jgi:putative endonuclease
MYYAYVLRSLKTGKHCYGSCEDLEKRLKTHNAGKVKYTKPFIPWVITCIVAVSQMGDSESSPYSCYSGIVQNLSPEEFALKYLAVGSVLFNGNLSRLKSVCYSRADIFEIN